MNRAAVSFVFALIAAVIPATSVAAGPENSPSPAVAATDDARAILVEREKRRPRSEEFLDELTVTSKDGKERRKTWRSFRAGSPEASDRLIRFLGPPDVRGVGYLAHYRRGRGPDEWLYLPSMKRERRIGARDRHAAFVGTSFSYEDLNFLEFDETLYDVKMLASRTVDGQDAYTIELTPLTRSAYVKKILTIQKNDLRLLSVDFFAAGNQAPVKRLTLSGYTNISGYEVAGRIEMADYRKANRTVVVVRDVMLDRMQPSDRYTIQNLLREDEDSGPARPGGRSSNARQTGEAASDEQSRRLGLPGTFTGYVEAKAFGYFGSSALRAVPSSGWGSAFLRGTGRIGAARLTASARLEETSSSQVGELQFDPADRKPLRSPLSLRTLSLTVPLRPALDLDVGRFEVAWGETDGYSPMGAFAPRDLTNPLTDEHLPLWGARLRGERGRLRFEYLGVPVTTPWRLPTLDSRSAPSTLDFIVSEHQWTVPKGGFQFGQVKTTLNGLDVGGWFRAGVRPAPVLASQLDSGVTNVVRTVQIDRHFANEQAGGGSLAASIGDWIVRGELGVFHSDDVLLRNAAIWSVGASRMIMNGTFTATVAANAIEPPVEPLLLFDRGLLPAVILAVRGYESWGNWRAAWLSTFHTVGNVVSVELTKNLTDVLALTSGVDLPDGATLSPAIALAGGKRARGALRWRW